MLPTATVCHASESDVTASKLSSPFQGPATGAPGCAALMPFGIFFFFFACAVLVLLSVCLSQGSGGPRNGSLPSW